MLEGDLVFVDKDCLEDVIGELNLYHEMQEILHRKYVVPVDISEIASMIGSKVMNTYFDGESDDHITMTRTHAIDVYNILCRYEELLKVGQRGSDLSDQA